MNCDVLYIHPSLTLHSSNMAFIPAGLIGVLNQLRRAGYSVLGINHALELGLDERFDLKTLLQQIHFKVAMIDLHWYVHSYTAIAIAQMIKSIDPRIPVILGGMTASLFAREIVRSYEEIDYIVRGEAEETTKVLIDRLLVATGQSGAVPGVVSQLHKTDLPLPTQPVMVLDKYDYVADDFLLHAKEYAEIEFLVGAASHFAITPARRLRWLLNGRGCRYRCAFCGGGRDAHWLISRRSQTSLVSPDKLVADIQRLAAVNIDMVALTHDPHAHGPEYWRPLFMSLQQQNFRVGLYNEFWGLPDAEFLQELRKTFIPEHTVLALSPLTGNEGLRRQNGKTFDNRKLLDCISRIQDANQRLLIYFSINLPGDSERCFGDTIDLVDSITRIATPGLVRMVCHRVLVDPHSPIYQQPEQWQARCERYSFDHYLRFFETYNATGKLGAGLSFCNNQENEAQRYEIDGQRLRIMNERIDSFHQSGISR